MIDDYDDGFYINDQNVLKNNSHVFQNHYMTNSKNAQCNRKSFKNYHTFASSLIPKNLGNLIILVFWLLPSPVSSIQ